MAITLKKVEEKLIKIANKVLAPINKLIPLPKGRIDKMKVRLKKHEVEKIWTKGELALVESLS